jgi:hypothetical protein
VHILAPTPELWTYSLTHRTQIVHELDQSMIIFMLGLQPGAALADSVGCSVRHVAHVHLCIGMVVLESGTGTGAMSTAIMRAISPDGHLHTVEFNESRVIGARHGIRLYALLKHDQRNDRSLVLGRTDFEANGISHLATVYHGDICKEPAEVPALQGLEGQVDAVRCRTYAMQSSCYCRRDDGVRHVLCLIGLPGCAPAVARDGQCPLRPQAQPPDRLLLAMFRAGRKGGAILCTNQISDTIDYLALQVQKTCQALKDYNFHCRFQGTRTRVDTGHRS